MVQQSPPQQHQTQQPKPPNSLPTAAPQSATVAARVATVSSTPPLGKVAAAKSAYMAAVTAATPTASAPTTPTQPTTVHVSSILVTRTTSPPPHQSTAQPPPPTAQPPPPTAQPPPPAAQPPSPAPGIDIVVDIVDIDESGVPPRPVSTPLPPPPPTHQRVLDADGGEFSTPPQTPKVFTTVVDMSTPRDDDDNDGNADDNAAVEADENDDDDGDELDLSRGDSKVRVKVKVRKTPSRGHAAPAVLQSSPSMPSMSALAGATHLLPSAELRKSEQRSPSRKNSTEPQPAAVVRSPWDVLGAKAMTDHAKKPKQQADANGSTSKGSLISRHTMPLFASELVERGDDSAPSTPTTNRDDEVPPPLPPSPTRAIDDDNDNATAATTTAATAPAPPPPPTVHDDMEDLAPYPSTRCSPISIETLSNALEALGVPLIALAGQRPSTTSSPASTKSDRRHTMKPQSIAPSPPTVAPVVPAPTPTKSSGSGVGARRAAAKEKRKTATLAQTH